MEYKPQRRDAKIERVPDSPKVSVVIPCFNQAQYLAESVTSVLDSYSGPLEILIVDDGSTAPKTGAYLRAAERLSPYVRVIAQANAGLSGARNTGIAAATGEFIQLLDSDDMIVPPKLDLQVSHFQLVRELDVSVTNFLLCDESRTIFSKHDEAIAHSDFSLADFLYKWERGFAIPIHCALFRRSILLKNPFDTTARAKEDWLFWCALSAGGARMAYLNAHHAIYRQHEQSMRRSYVKMGKSWLHAAAKIDEIVGQREPAFFESAIDWFENFYRKHPAYVEEIAAVRESSSTRGKDSTPAATEKASVDPSIKIERLTRAAQGMSSGAPFLSVVVPVYNHYDYVEDCLLSIISQTDVPFEIICVDDCSTDYRTTSLVEGLQGIHANLIALRNVQNLGISRTQNEAVAAARGEYIAFVDCDDGLVSGALATVAGVLRAEPRVDYLFTDRLDVDEEGELVRRADYGGYATIKFRGGDYITEDLLDGMVASHLKVIRRSAYLNAGGSDDAFSGIQDWDLALKIAEHGKFRYLHEPLYRHRVHRGSVTRSDSIAQFRKTNIVRRRFASRWLRESVAGTGGAARFSSQDANLPTISELREIWKRGDRVEFYVAPVVDVPVLNFLREYNSYFDRIYWEDPETYAGLIGYLWGDILEGPRHV